MHDNAIYQLEFRWQELNQSSSLYSQMNVDDIAISGRSIDGDITL